MYKKPILTLIFSLLFAVFPIILVVIAGSIATLSGCELNEGGVNPCSVFGVELGGILYFMGVSGWFMFLTIPVGIVMFICCVIWLIYVLIKNRST